MTKFLELRFLFTLVAVLEFFYAAAALLIPPGMVQGLTGWVLSADGHWIVKLLGFSLGTQALIAWLFRKNPTIPLASALALYQIGSATTDWVMWLLLSDQGIFSTDLGRLGVMAAIPSHYLTGLLLVLGIIKIRKGDQK